MYLGRGETKIISSYPHTLTKRADVSMKHKEVTSKYKDINSVPREDFIGYMLSFEFTYIFKQDEEAAQTMLRTLVNDRTVTVTPRMDQGDINYECTLKITEDEQKDQYDIIKVTAAVIESVSDIPFRPFEVILSPEGRTFPAGGSVQVTMKCVTPGASIYYTTDGSTPTDESTPYVSEFSINTTTTVKAIAVVESFVSDVASQVYTEDPT